MTQANHKIYFAVDEDGSEWWFGKKPKKSRMVKMWDLEAIGDPCGKLFPGAIQAITGVTLTWQDEPLEWVVGANDTMKLIEKQREYIQLLTDELNDVVGMASIHGWSSTRFEQGKKLRDEIALLTKPTPAG